MAGAVHSSSNPSNFQEKKNMLRVSAYAMTVAVVFATSVGHSYAQERTTSPAPAQRPQQQQSQQPTAQQRQGLTNEMTPQSFVQHVVESNQKEIDIAKLAAGRAASADVKAFANQLVTDHTKALATAKSYATKKNITLSSPSKSDTPSMQQRTQSSQTTGRPEDGTKRTDTQDRTDTQTRTETPSRTETTQAGRAGNVAADTDHSAHMTDLSAKSGAEFDKAFMQMMVENHEKGVALFERQSQAKLGDQELQRFINDTLPTLRRHLGRAKEINAKVAGGNQTRTPNR
jgi:putative membrane protein